MKTECIGCGIVMGMLCSFLLPIAEFLTFTFFAVLIDLYTGWRASGKPLHSRGIRRTFEKMVMYMLGILIAHGFDLVYVPNSTYITFAISGIVAVTEVVSIYENIDRKIGTGLLQVFQKLFTKDGSNRQ